MKYQIFVKTLYVILLLAMVVSFLLKMYYHGIGYGILATNILLLLVLKKIDK